MKHFDCRYRIGHYYTYHIIRILTYLRGSNCMYLVILTPPAPGMTQV